MPLHDLCQRRADFLRRSQPGGAVRLHALLPAFAVQRAPTHQEGAARTGAPPPAGHPTPPEVSACGALQAEQSSPRVYPGGTLFLSPPMLPMEMSSPYAQGSSVPP